MTKKSENTRRMILRRVYGLFAKKGFKAVTMKDVCIVCGLSRGGLYAHFSSTAEVFEALIDSLGELDETDYLSGIADKRPAVDVLLNGLQTLQKEMNASEDSLSLAIYEYACETKGKGIADFVENGKRVWRDILDYGIKTGEFNRIDVEEIVNLLMFTYQGVRMWSRIIDVTPAMTESIINHIKKLVIKADLEQEGN